MQDLGSQQPLVSVVIATYNMGQYLPQAIDSILHQGWQNLEIVVVDDGSKDNTAAVLASYDANPRVRYVCNDNQGQPKAKNCGIKLTRGDFIAFCDADDLWEPTKLEVQMPLFANSRIGVVYSEVSNIDEHNQRYEKPPAYARHAGKVTDQLLIRNFVPFGTAVIRRECIEQCGVFDEQFRMGIDWDLWLRYSLFWEFAYTPERTYIYREWSGQMSTNYRGRYDFAIRILANFIQNHGTMLNPRAVRAAWADMYISQANALASNERAIKEPIKGYLKGLAKDPFYYYGWRSFAKFILGRQRKRI